MYKIDKITTPNLMFYCYFNDAILALIRIDVARKINSNFRILKHHKSTTHFLRENHECVNWSICTFNHPVAYLKKTENGLAYIPKFVTCQNMSVVNVVVRKDSYLSLVSLRCYHNTSWHIPFAKLS